jgi:hypothetical protein
MADDSPTRRDDPDDQPTVRGLAAGRAVFGRYQLEAIAGRGGMGVVWRARDEELERVVALKFLPEAVAADHEAIRDLMRETRRCLDLTHPNVVRMHDLVQDDRMAAISMEYVDGESLAKRKAAAQWPTPPGRNGRHTEASGSMRHLTPCGRTKSGRAGAGKGQAGVAAPNAPGCRPALGVGRMRLVAQTGRVFAEAT